MAALSRLRNFVDVDESGNISQTTNFRGALEETTTQQNDGNSMSALQDEDGGTT